MSTSATAADPSATAVAAATPKGVARERGLRSFAIKFGPPFLVFVLFIGIWSAVSVLVYGDRHYLLPTPWDVVTSGWDNRTELLHATKITLVESAVGFAMAITIGMGFAVLMSQAKAVERSLYPYAVMLQTVPIVAVAPVIVLWFGYNQKSVIVVAFMIAVFPILNNTLLGLLSTDRNQVDLFRLHKANRIREFRKLRLPNALPNIFAGLRVSAGLAVVGAIVGEFIIGSGGSEGGLGVKVIYAQGKLDTNLLFAEVVAATLLGFLFFVTVSYIGNLLLHNWHESALRREA